MLNLAARDWTLDTWSRIPAIMPASKKSNILAENGNFRNLSLTPARLSTFLAGAPSMLFLGPVWEELPEFSVKCAFTCLSSVTWKKHKFRIKFRSEYIINYFSKVCFKSLKYVFVARSSNYFAKKQLFHFWELLSSNCTGHINCTLFLKIHLQLFPNFNHHKPLSTWYLTVGPIKLWNRKTTFRLNYNYI